MRVFEHERDEIRGEWRRLHKDELYYYYYYYYYLLQLDSRLVEEVLHQVQTK
jgi:hypothetical protein